MYIVTKYIYHILQPFFLIKTRKVTCCQQGKLVESFGLWVRQMQVMALERVQILWLTSSTPRSHPKEI